MSQITVTRGDKTATVSVELMPGMKRHGLYLVETWHDGTTNFEPLAYFVSEEKSQRFEEWLAFAFGPEEE